MTEKQILDLASKRAVKWFKNFLKEIGYDECEFGWDDTREQCQSLRRAIKTGEESK